MRPIKFRAWDGRKMHIVGNIHFDQVGGYSFCKTAEENCRILTGAPIMQFTGLHDKNGKEIWEGDIVRNYSYNYAEEYVPFLNEVKFQDGAFYPIVEMQAKEFEVLGNIYENPELVK